MNGDLETRNGEGLDSEGPANSVHARELGEGSTTRAAVPVIHNANTGDGLVAGSGERGAGSEGPGSFNRRLAAGAELLKRATGLPERMVYAEPMESGWMYWVFVGGEIEMSGKVFSGKDIVPREFLEVIPRECVLVDDGFRTQETRQLAAEMGWQAGRFMQSRNHESPAWVKTYEKSTSQRKGLSFDRWEGQMWRAGEAVKGSGILEDLEGEPLSLGERRHLAWLVNRAMKHGQVVILEGDRIGLNAVEGAMSDAGSTEVWIRLREGALQGEEGLD